MSQALNSRQFGRYVEVEIRDFKAKTKTTITNEFEIEFEYFKSLDQVTEDDSGKIKIYGLTPERILSLQESGGEVVLRCRYRNNTLETLFQCYISRLYAEVSDNTTITTIECSSNLLNYYQTGTISSQGGTSISDFVDKLAKNLGASNGLIHIPLRNNSEQDRAYLEQLKEYIAEADFRLTSVGNYQEILEEFCEGLGFDLLKEDLTENNFIYVFTLNIKGETRMLEEISLGYSKVKRGSSNPDAKNNVEFLTIKESQEADGESRRLIILTEETGLLSAKIEYKIATAYADQELFDYEIETLKSKQQGIDQQAKIAEMQAKEQAKELKAREAGKEYKPKKRNYRTTIKVNRKYVRVKALLNPSVKPQGIVAVPESVAVKKSTNEIISYFDLEEVAYEDRAENTLVIIPLRVRDVKFKGNNKRGDWIMDIYGEDTSSKEVIDEVFIKQLQRSNAPEDVTNEDVNTGEQDFGD